jgi:nucleotide-binding universal stress UspA family protein
MKREMKILVAYDGSASADIAIDQLRRAGLPEQAEAFVICTADGELTETAQGERAATDSSWRAKLACAQALAERAAARIRSHFPQWTVISDGIWGSPATTILATVGWWGPDLVVIGSHGHSAVARFFLGSVSLELIHKAACSVRVARKTASAVCDPVRIVIGSDGSVHAEAVIRAVATRSWPKNTEVHVVSVVQTLAPVTTSMDASTFAQEPAYTVIREADERMRSRFESTAAEGVNILCRSGLVAKSVVVDGDPREAILIAAEAVNADAIFLGARGLGRMQRLLLGSVSSYVVNHAPCSVEVVRGDHG